MWHVAALISSLLALGSWMVLCLIAQPPRIEEALRLETEQVLAEANLGDVRVAVNGRDATLKGSVASADASADAERRVAGVVGIRAVDNLLAVREVAAVAEPVPATYLEISVGRDGMSLRGTVPNEALRSDIVARARQLFGVDRVHEQLSVDATIPGGAALDGATGVVSALAEAGQGTLRARLEGDGLRLSGTVASADVRRRIERQARAATPGVRLFFSALTLTSGDRETGES